MWVKQSPLRVKKKVGIRRIKGKKIREEERERQKKRGGRRERGT